MRPDDVQLANTLAYARTLQDYIASRGKRDAAYQSVPVEPLKNAMDALFALAESGTRNCYPLVIRFAEASRAQLPAMVSALTSALAAVKAETARVSQVTPRDRDLYVLATMDGYHDTFEFDDVEATSLSIQDCGYQIDGFFDDVPKIARFSKLVTLCAFGNDLQTFSVDTRGLTALRSIDLCQNQLRAFPEALLDCSALEYLSLTQNPLASVPEDIGRLTSLRFLNVSATRLTKEQIAFLRRSLPRCHVEDASLVYTDVERRMNFVIASPDWVMLGSGEVLPDATVLPRGRGVHTLSAMAFVPGHGEVVCAMQLNSRDGKARLYFRGEDGRWSDVTDIAARVEPRYPLAERSGWAR